jgi:hypothetical protein
MGGTMGSYAVNLRPLRIMAVAAFALLAVGCSQNATAVGNSHVMVARDNSNGKTVRVSVGDRLELVLASSYWNVDGSTSPAVLRQDGPTSYLAPPSDCSTMPGSGCVPEQTSFTALAPGTAVLTASRESCGEALQCAPDQTRFRLTVIVR